jgi:hypothetical protein
VETDPLCVDLNFICLKIDRGESVISIQGGLTGLRKGMMWFSLAAIVMCLLLFVLKH